MLGSAIIDLAIGLAFVFGVTAALSSVITELFARYLGLRASYLLRGLRELLDSRDAETRLNSVTQDYHALKRLMTASPPAHQTSISATGALLGCPILRGQGMTGQISSRPLTVKGKAGGRPKLPAISGQGPIWHKWRDLRGLPSYIPARSFAAAVIDLLVPDASQATTLDTIRRSIAGLPDKMPLKGSLETLVKGVSTDIDAFRTEVENWYDDHMERVSGWYKRNTGRITLGVGAILVLLLNVNALTIGRTLYENSAIRTAVANVAVKSTRCPPGPGTGTTAQNGQTTCLENLGKQLSTAAGAGLPLGWGTVAECAPKGMGCNWMDRRGLFSRQGGSPVNLLLVIVGFLITIVALVPGARFWFALLSKLGPLRSTGPKPSASAAEGAAG